MPTNRFIRVLRTFYKNYENQLVLSKTLFSHLADERLPTFLSHLHGHEPRAQKEISLVILMFCNACTLRCRFTSRTPLGLLTHPWPFQTTESNILYRSQMLGFQCNIPKDPRNSLQHRNCSRTLTKVITRRILYS